ncbi:Bug family tripartite tricarboxylate transporter substrate binding protein [Paraburkholderia susongensis]|uniref:Tripartite-type tricarboxylate transporter, receptor component TctC n=1 Tax=Paraburkholderia susongensis TaxID=1515439 RepID=A0A1X7M4U6_9BURK|nr:tripartite tricarboxylate transporter substrate binding protein [Paraburkholderia susongensis]SMG60727.1 Tripartite-type tricarboxylate transporter, receptor component TctC [Paraburkholderia susongensis]
MQSRKRQTSMVLQIIRILLCGLVALASMSVSAENGNDYPSRPLHIIVPANAGSGLDNGIRPLAKYMTGTAGWTTVIDNRGGGHGFIAAHAFLRAPKDGYTIFTGGSSTMAYNPIVFKHAPYDPLDDFTPVARAMIVPDILVVSAKSGIRSVADLVARLRAQPGRLFFASENVNLLPAELFLQSQHLDATNVYYRSSPAAMIDLIGGSIEFMFVDSIAALSMIRAGYLTPLAVTSGKRLHALPDVPTLTETGVANLKFFEWSGLFLPKNAPPEQVDRLHKVVDAYFHTPAAARYLDHVGGQYEDISPADFRQWIANDIARNRVTYQSFTASEE